LIKETIKVRITRFIQQENISNGAHPQRPYLMVKDPAKGPFPKGYAVYTNTDRTRMTQIGRIKRILNVVPDIKI